MIRAATVADAEALEQVDRETWSFTASPVAYEPHAFFANTRPDEVLVACVDGEPVGYIALRPPTPLPSNAHVLSIVGLAVRESMQGRGIGRALLAAVDHHAARQHVTRITLRVLAPNASARALYAKAGYREEGVLRGEFLLPLGPDTALVAVDDVLMARTPPAG